MGRPFALGADILGILTQGYPMTYDVILSDCPWSYGDKMSGHSFSLDHEYKTMPLSWIKGLPVANIAAKDALLFLWATSPLLPEALEVIKAWGFKFKTVAFCWSKRTTGGKEAVNLGRWTMGNVELCLLGTRGKPVRHVRNVRQLVTSVRGRHSAKPPEVRDRISLIAGPDARKLEMFARQAADGWDSWGDQSPGSLDLFPA